MSTDTHAVSERAGSFSKKQAHTASTSRIAKPNLLLKHIGPERVVAYGVLTWATVFALAPVVVTVQIAWEPILFLLASYGALILGMQFPLDNSQPLPRTSPRDLRRMLMLASAVGIVGMTLKLYDFYSIRGVDIAQNVISEGKEAANAGASAVSAIAAVLYPCCYLVLFLFLASTEGKKRKWLPHGAALLLTLAPGILGIIQGSRSRLLVCSALVAVYYIYFGMLKINLRTIAVVSTVAIGLSTLFALVFMNRLEAMNMSPSVSVYQSVYAFTVRPNAWADAALGSEGLRYDVALSALSMSQYFVHGVFEFIYLFQNFNGPHTWGAYTFAAYSKAWSMATGGGDSFQQVMNVVPRLGSFTTFFGSTYVDFGWFSLVYLACLGVAIKGLWTRAFKRDYGCAPLYCYAVVVMFFMPLTNFINGAEGLYTITLMAVYWAILFGRSRA